MNPYKLPQPGAAPLVRGFSTTYISYSGWQSPIKKQGFIHPCSNAPSPKKKYSELEKRNRTFSAYSSNSPSPSGRSSRKTLEAGKKESGKTCDTPTSQCLNKSEQDLAELSPMEMRRPTPILSKGFGEWTLKIEEVANESSCRHLQKFEKYSKHPNVVQESGCSTTRANRVYSMEECSFSSYSGNDEYPAELWLRSPKNSQENPREEIKKPFVSVKTAEEKKKENSKSLKQSKSPDPFEAQHVVSENKLKDLLENSSFSAGIMASEFAKADMKPYKDFIISLFESIVFIKEMKSSTEEKIKVNQQISGKLFILLFEN